MNNESHDYGPWCFAGCCIALLCLFAGGALYNCGIDKGRAAERADALAKGAAHYTVAPSTGETKFEYIKKDETK